MRVKVKPERGVEFCSQFKMVQRMFPKLRCIPRYVYREKLNWDKWTSENVYQARAAAACLKYVADQSFGAKSSNGLSSFGNVYLDPKMA